MKRVYQHTVAFDVATNVSQECMCRIVGLSWSSIKISIDSAGVKKRQAPQSRADNAQSNSPSTGYVINVVKGFLFLLILKRHCPRPAAETGPIHCSYALVLFACRE